MQVDTFYPPDRFIQSLDNCGMVMSIRKYIVNGNNE